MGRVKPDDAAIAEALRRLNEHVASPERLEQDARIVGPRLNVVTVVLLLIAVGLGGLAVAGFMVDRTSLLRSLIPLFIILFVVFSVIFVVSLINVLMVLPRNKATDPLAALRGVWRAVKLASPGYFIASLCPTGREETLAPPDIDQYPTGQGRFSMNDKRQARDYLRRWAASGAGQVRWINVRKMKVVEHTADVAVVRSELKLQAWPQWANIVSVVLFLAVRILGLIVALVLYYALRKKQIVTVEKVLLRGENGVWYLLSGSLDR